MIESSRFLSLPQLHVSQMMNNMERTSWGDDTWATLWSNFVTLLVLARKMNFKISYSMHNFEIYIMIMVTLIQCFPRNIIFSRVAKGIWNGLFWSNPSVV